MRGTAGVCVVVRYHLQAINTDFSFNSLSTEALSVVLVAPNTAPSEETSKRVADTLFDSDNDEDQDADNDFRIRPQYEGRKGQKVRIFVEYLNISDMHLSVS